MKWLAVLLLLFSFSFAQRFTAPTPRMPTYTAPRVTVPRITTPARTPTYASPTRSVMPVPVNPRPGVYTPPRPRAAVITPQTYNAAPLYRGQYRTHNYYSDYQSNNGVANMFPWLFYWSATQNMNTNAPTTATEVGGVRWMDLAWILLLALTIIVVVWLFVFILRDMFGTRRV